jgi:electron transfer flavoprotein beta subunit
MTKMKIVCLVKFLPDVENFRYDYEKNVLIRENVNLILKPDDEAALAFALNVKEREPETFIEVVSMAPQSVIPHLEDLVRRDIDKATLISDRLYVGSDTYITCKILARYLEKEEFDFIFTGTHTLDGDTSHVPSQVGELLDIHQISGIVKMDEELFSKNTAVVVVDSECVLSTYQIELEPH